MKVLHIRLDAPNYSSEAIEKGFKDNGFEYLGLKWQEMRFNLGTEVMRQQVIHSARVFNPDIIFCHIQNSEAFTLDNYKELQTIGKVVNFTFDVRNKEKSQWMYDIAPLINHTFFSCHEDVLNCRELGIENVGNILPSCDMDIYRTYPNQIKIEKQIAFIGSTFKSTNLEFDMTEEREQMVSMLETEYLSNFIVKGMGWRFSKLANQQDEVNLYNTSAIAISQNNFNRIDYTSDRLFRIMACGCFCLTKYFTGIEKHFKDGVHLDYWKDLSELKRKIDYYLIHKEEREAIAKMGQQVVRENNTWTNRIEEMIKLIS